MNERILELALQAGYKDSPTVRLAFQGFDKEKFALLIVRECLYNMQNCDGDLDFAIWKTKKDFGVNDEKI